MFDKRYSIFLLFTLGYLGKIGESRCNFSKKKEDTLLESLQEKSKNRKAKRISIIVHIFWICYSFLTPFSPIYIIDKKKEERL